ncbi:hypothetical protein BKA70DRAFT_1114137 [Coprinopsis sp. MPI-PUGE-AT-0042]|nr:hypothetical protein BKA70DRAFT_1114137 [Coprinopsis sp. MPI-PUGE-AT-0042]
MSASPLIRPGDGGMSDGGSSDGGHSVGSQSRAGGSFGRRRGFVQDLNKPGEPYAFQYEQRRSRAGSTASSSSQPSTQHTQGYDSIEPSPLITSQPLAPGQPPSATNPTFSNAFGSLTLDDANALASLGSLDGRSNLPADDTAAVSSSVQSNTSTSLSGASNSTANTSARSGASNSLPGFSPIQRPLSSLAAYPPSTYLNQTWQQGAAQQAALGGVSDDNLFAWGAGGGYGGGTGWTPGIGSLADFNFDEGSGSGSGSDGSSGHGGLVPGFGGIPSGLTPTPGKEDGGKDLKEFWKMYMRTPLTGPAFDPLGAGNSTTTPGGNAALAAGGNNPNATPFRRPRVASMPSSNSITRVHRDGAVAHLQQLQALSQQQKALGPMSSWRTTLHGPLGDGSSNANDSQQEMRGPQEDLSSYGAAVMARKTPVNLSLARALGRMKKQQQAAQAHSQGSHHHRAGSITTDGSDSPGASSRASSVGFGDDVPMADAAGATSGEHVVRPRPSVKRLASSVLESEIHKVGRFEGDSDEITPKGNNGVSQSDSSSTVVAPKPSAPFAMPQAEGGDGMKKSTGMFPPPAMLGGSGASSMMPPPPNMGLGSRPPSLLERRSRMAQAQQAQAVSSTELQ